MKIEFRADLSYKLVEAEADNKSGIGSGSRVISLQSKQELLKGETLCVEEEEEAVGVIFKILEVEAEMSYKFGGEEEAVPRLQHLCMTSHNSIIF